MYHSIALSLLVLPVLLSNIPIDCASFVVGNFAKDNFWGPMEAPRGTWGSKKTEVRFWALENYP